MKVKLINYQAGALELLIYTKSTRLQGDTTLEDIDKWDWDMKMLHLDYMRETISSSWEFVTYIFEITDVSRVFTHQLVRSRHQSYAQQSQRAVNVKDMGFYRMSSDDYDSGELDKFDMSCASGVDDYTALVDEGMTLQDARYVLPEGTLTNIIVGTNLRVLSETAEVRLCKRASGEYQEVFKAMKAAVLEVHAWANKFIEVACVKTGICIFPNYRNCPVQKYTICISDVQKNIIKDNWTKIQHVANPVAKDGRTM